ncbi:hypothetical protein N7533_012976 [Penicillium manginii]|jgi:hypothetical protein|uniref:uncharacterized protein n=1 Tax=Penicillium manginii TaxID=203109 RepID=UPI002546CF13|nr:uncharacterized protein N7533_012976 [Penicillium manginii]KAJ5734573.1 hypothetical protein N7533_012976 [Penicillium manginii]
MDNRHPKCKEADHPSFEPAAIGKIVAHRGNSDQRRRLEGMGLRHFERVLRRGHLNDLIDANLPRPKFQVNNLLVEEWRPCSETVATWLFRGVSEVIYLSVTGRRNREDLKYADDVWCTLKLVCQLEGHSPYSAARILTSFNDIRAAEYDNPVTFINAVVAEYAMVKEVGIKYNTYGLLILFLNGVEKFNSLLSDLMFLKLGTEGREPSDYTEMYFYRVVDEVKAM